jgi:uncharacterized membrane protein YkoI
MSRNALLVSALLLFVPASPVLAQTEAPKQSATTPAPRIDEANARRIAWRHGLVHVEEIRLYADRWEIAGRDRSGFEATFDVDANTGLLLR